MIFKKLPVLALLVSLFFASCSWVSSCKGVFQEIFSPKGRHSVVVVMCDVTRSLDSTALKEVTENAVRILEKSPEADVIFYPIDSNLYVNPIYKKESYIGKRYSERRALQDSAVQELRKNIQKIYQGKSIKASCVMKGFPIAYNCFRQYPPEEYEYKLVFLSDMLEYCLYSDRFINLEKRDAYDSSLNAIRQLPKPEFDLAKMKVKITFVVTAYRQLPIDEGLHRDFWREACKRYGYSDAEFNDFYFGGDLPANF